MRSTRSQQGTTLVALPTLPPKGDAKRDAAAEKASRSKAATELVVVSQPGSQAEASASPAAATGASPRDKRAPSAPTPQQQTAAGKKGGKGTADKASGAAASKGGKAAINKSPPATKPDAAPAAEPAPPADGKASKSSKGSKAAAGDKAEPAADTKAGTAAGSKGKKAGSSKATKAADNKASTTAPADADAGSPKPTEAAPADKAEGAGAAAKAQAAKGGKASDRAAADKADAAAGSKASGGPASKASKAAPPSKAQGDAGAKAGASKANTGAASTKPSGPKINKELLALGGSALLGSPNSVNSPPRAAKRAAAARITAQVTDKPLVSPEPQADAPKPASPAAVQTADKGSPQPAGSPAAAADAPTPGGDSRKRKEPDGAADAAADGTEQRQNKKPATEARAGGDGAEVRPWHCPMILPEREQPAATDADPGPSAAAGADAAAPPACVAAAATAQPRNALDAKLRVFSAARAAAMRAGLPQPASSGSTEYDSAREDGSEDEWADASNYGYDWRSFAGSPGMPMLRSPLFRAGAPGSLPILPRALPRKVLRPYPTGDNAPHYVSMTGAEKTLPAVLAARVGDMHCLVYPGSGMCSVLTDGKPCDLKVWPRVLHRVAEVPESDWLDAIELVGSSQARKRCLPLREWIGLNLGVLQAADSPLAWIGWRLVRGLVRDKSVPVPKNEVTPPMWLAKPELYQPHELPTCRRGATMVQRLLRKTANDNAENPAQQQHFAPNLKRLGGWTVYLPYSSPQLVASLEDMVDVWVAAGQPPSATAAHPFFPRSHIVTLVGRFFARDPPHDGSYAAHLVNPKTRGQWKVLDPDAVASSDDDDHGSGDAADVYGLIDVDPEDDARPYKPKKRPWSEWAVMPEWVLTKFGKAEMDRIAAERARQEAEDEEDENDGDTQMSEDGSGDETGDGDDEAGDAAAARVAGGKPPLPPDGKRRLGVAGEGEEEEEEGVCRVAVRRGPIVPRLSSSSVVSRGLPAANAAANGSAAYNASRQSRGYQEWVDSSYWHAYANGWYAPPQPSADAPQQPADDASAHDAYVQVWPLGGYAGPAVAADYAAPWAEHAASASSAVDATSEKLAAVLAAAQELAAAAASPGRAAVVAQKVLTAVSEATEANEAAKRILQFVQPEKTGAEETVLRLTGADVDMPDAPQGVTGAEGSDTAQAAGTMGGGSPAKALGVAPMECTSPVS